MKASVNITTIEPNSAYSPVTKTISADIEIGNNSGPMPIEKQASKIQLPIVFPIVNPCSFFRIAVKLTKSSGRDVPMATAKKLTMYSDMLKISDSLITDWITKYAPMATPAKPIATRIKW